MQDAALADSAEQREAEPWLVAALSKKLNVRLTNKRRLPLKEGGYVELDGCSESPPVLCEAWAHLGAPKPAQKNKVMTDALKLLYASKLLKGKSRKILLFADEKAANAFRGTSWRAQLLKEHNIELRVVELPPRLRRKVKEAQVRQNRYG